MTIVFLFVYTPILMEGFLEKGASITPLDEFPIKPELLQKLAKIIFTKIFYIINISIF